MKTAFLRAKIRIGDFDGAPKETRMGLNDMKGNEVMEMILTMKPTKTPEAGYFYIGLFVQEPSEGSAKEINYPGYKRAAIKRDATGFGMFKTPTGYFISNRQPIVFAPLYKMTIINKVGLFDYKGKVLAFGFVERPIMDFQIIPCFSQNSLMLTV